jgi:hypothetical protein
LGGDSSKPEGGELRNLQHKDVLKANLFLLTYPFSMNAVPLRQVNGLAMGEVTALGRADKLASSLNIPYQRLVAIFFFHLPLRRRVQTGSGTHPASYIMSTGAPFPGKATGLWS